MRRFNRTKQDRDSKDLKSKDAYTIELGDRAYKTLNQSKTLVQPIDPNRQIQQSPVPYKICVNGNRVKDGYYPGVQNDSGNLLDLLPTSLRSQFLNSYDLMHMELNFKYMYLAIQSSDKNKAANIQYGRSFTEALAKVASDTFTDLPFFKDYYYSGMPSTGVAQGYAEVLTWYQSMLCNMALPLTAYGKMLALEDTMKMMGYNREAPIVTELMGLFRKKAFQAYMKTLNGYIKSNYLDIPWFKQINTLANAVSRQADDCRHPLLTLTASVDVPTIEAWHTERPTHPGPTDLPYFSSTDYVVSITGGTYSFEKAINLVCSAMSPYEIIRWARKKAAGTLIQTDPQTATQYYNRVKDMMDGILGVLARFPADTAEIKTMLDVAQRGNLNRWTIGVFFDINDRATEHPEFNKIVFDIVRSYMATSYSLGWDTKTLKWTFKTPWDEVMGIPEYDRFNGGSFLTFSNFDLPVSSSETGLEQKFLVPILYRIDPVGDEQAEIEMCNRKGESVSIQRVERTITNDALMARLNLMKDSNFSQIVMPTVHTIGTDTLTADQKSAALFTLEQIFGFGALSHGSAPTPEETDITDETLNANIIGFIDIELADVSNDMIVYYQTYSPLKVYTSDTSRTIGFDEKTDISFR